MRTIGETCPVCKREIKETTYDYGRFPYTFCSEYCEETTEAEEKEFLAAKEGDFCVFPCAECGCPMEDELKQGAMCSICHPKVRARARKGLLERALTTIIDMGGEKSQSVLLAEIRAELERSP